MDQLDIGMLVTKESGKEGGFDEKAEAARIRGSRLVIIRRPPEEGVSLEELLRIIQEQTKVCSEAHGEKNKNEG